MQCIDNQANLEQAAWDTREKVLGIPHQREKLLCNVRHTTAVSHPFLETDIISFSLDESSQLHRHCYRHQKSHALRL